jgi:amino acid transporter
MPLLKKETSCDDLESPYWNKIITLLILLGFFLPCPAYATGMPGVMDYALLILLVSFIAGVVVATVVTLILFLIFKQKYSGKNYLKWWVVIALAFPILAMLVFGIVLAT